MIAIRSESQIQAIAQASRIVAQALSLARSLVSPGVSLLYLDKKVENFILDQNALPSFKGLYGFPNTCCISVNEVVIHGIPDEYILKPGDLVSIDVGVNLNGWFGDGAITLGAGEISDTDQKLIECSKSSLSKAIDSIQPGMHFKELSAILESSIKACGFVPLHDYCGHGIGRNPHEDPHIFNYVVGGKLKQGPKIKNGMVFCIEPMVCQKDSEPMVLDDGWGVVSKDQLNTAHYEHTVAVIDNRAVILTKE